MTWNLVGLMRREARRAEMLAEQVVSAARERVWLRAEQQIGLMNVHQARGYARARAAMVVCREAEKVLRRQSRPVGSALRERVVETALAAVVEWAVARRRLTPMAMSRAA